MKDLTGYISKEKGEFFVDREDLDTGLRLVKPGDQIQFIYRKKSYQALVTDDARGRDDDIYRLELM